VYDGNCNTPRDRRSIRKLGKYDKEHSIRGDANNARFVPSVSFIGASPSKMARTRVRGICCGIGYLQCSARNSMPTLFRSHGFSHRQAISSSIWYPEQWCRARRIRAARGRLVFRSRSCSGGWGCDARSEDRARSRGARACPPVFSETAISAPSSAACLLGRPWAGPPTGGTAAPRREGANTRNEDDFATASSICAGPHRRKNVRALVLLGPRLRGSAS
jgi:hypothetical protein